MTVQEKIDWLDQYRDLNREIDRELEELSRWRSRAEQITPDTSGIPGGGSEDRIQTAIEKICEIENQIKDKIDRLISLRQEIERTIDAVPDSRYREVLRRKYIDGCTFEQIAEKMDRSDRWVKYLHKCALRQVFLVVHHKPML